MASILSIMEGEDQVLDRRILTTLKVSCQKT